eukprot:2456902-Heterocapsa_arctica.AAC.1
MVPCVDSQIMHAIPAYLVSVFLRWSFHCKMVALYPKEEVGVSATGVQTGSSDVPVELSSKRLLPPPSVLALPPVLPHVQKPLQCVSNQLGVCSLPSPLRLQV